MVVFAQKWLYSGKKICIREKLLYSGKSGSVRAKVVVIGQNLLYSGKVFYSNNGGCIQPLLPEYNHICPKTTDFAQIQALCPN